MMSKWFEVLNINVICEGANANLQVYYGIMSGDQGTVHIEVSWGKSTRECPYTPVMPSIPVQEDVEIEMETV